MSAPAYVSGLSPSQQSIVLGDVGRASQAPGPGDWLLEYYVTREAPGRQATVYGSPFGQFWAYRTHNTGDEAGVYTEGGPFALSDGTQIVSGITETPVEVEIRWGPTPTAGSNWSGWSLIKTL